MVLQAVATNVASQAASGILNKAFGGGKKGPTYAQQLYMQGEAQTMRHAQMAKADITARVAGAKQAGIHPLAALGVSPSSGPSFNVTPSHDTRAASDLGQNISRAVQAGVQGYREKQIHDLTIERMQLENDLLEGQISTVNYQAGDPPTVVGGIDQNKVQMNPTERLHHETSDRSTAYGANRLPLPASDRVRTQSDHTVRTLSKQAKELLEDDPEAYLQVVFHDRWLPAAKRVFSKKTMDDYRWLFKQIGKREKRKVQQRLKNKNKSVFNTSNW
jgi:hypothetical protein